MIDTITTVGNSLIQHGRYNDRIYLMKLSQHDFPEIIESLDSLASQEGYTKIFAKIPEYAKGTFLESGYELEATIPKFYNGSQSAHFISKYLSDQRNQLQNLDKINDVLRVAQSKLEDSPITGPSTDFTYRQCQTADIHDIAELYKKVFETYPFPIQDPDYILKTMQDNVTYFGVWNNECLIALASAEVDREANNVEMTDFATNPKYQGKALSAVLLQTMEKHVEGLGIKTAYTIARSLSYGMNITFAKLGYSYSGTLINNTNISGSLESMNVWYKPLF